MVRGFSKAIITGNVTRDPEMRTTTSGANVATVTVAVNRSFKGSNGETQESVSFIDCVFWGKPAEIACQYAKKGTGILVSGRLEQRSWEDKESGQKRSRVEIVMEDFNFLGGTNERGDAPAFEKSGSEDAKVDVIPDDIDIDQDINVDDIPF